jgi:hypothetical protein
MAGNVLSRWARTLSMQAADSEAAFAGIPPVYTTKGNSVLSMVLIAGSHKVKPGVLR